MGSKLAAVAAVAALVAMAGTAAADRPGAAALKKGLELYKAGKYAEARVQLEKAYKADPSPNTLFTLAQAERLAGDCLAAAGHYKQVIAEIGDLNVAKLVQQNLLMCEPAQDDAPRKPAPVQVKEDEDDDRRKDDSSSEPQLVEKTIVRSERKTDKLGVILLGGGMLALGGAAGLYVAASSNAEAADLARSLEDHDKLADKAKTERTLMYVAAGAGALMVGAALVKFALGGSKESDAAVAVVPTGSGGSVLVTSHF